MKICVRRIVRELQVSRIELTGIKVVVDRIESLSRLRRLEGNF